ncbi:endoglucanase-like isoform X2 [Diabrotica virgifera virgifera]|uniref:Cellulase n=1 Tax=Diabrotica virgifera virgifera TaxID=50390 RepID=A0A6P7GD14_DIAVI|nr:endoglucanase-like isoform X2 [Diabrotica virgifera virgifera]
MIFNCFIFSVVLAVTLAYSPEIKKIVGGKSGYGTTTRYWDCCKPSCAWKENIKTPDMEPIATCATDGVTVVNASVQSGCIGGTSYMCNNQQPFVVNETLGYGFAAVSFSGGVDNDLCCSCYLLTFQNQINNKKLVLQFTNTGGDLGSNQFDIALPGGGVGAFNQGCHDQWNAPWTGWGQQYGGISSREECLSLLPKELQSGCLFRFDFMQNANNPQMYFEQVECPAELVKISGCSLPL